MAHTFQVVINKERFEAKRRAVNQVTAGPMYGVLTYEGVTLGYTYGGNVLRIEIQDKPFIYPNLVVEQKVREWLAAD